MSPWVPSDCSPADLEGHRIRWMPMAKRISPLNDYAMRHPFSVAVGSGAFFGLICHAQGDTAKLEPADRPPDSGID